jgi:hypothetical protein
MPDVALRSEARCRERPDQIMEQFQVNQLVKVFKIYPNLEAALKSDG